MPHVTPQSRRLFYASVMELLPDKKRKLYKVESLKAPGEGNLLLGLKRHPELKQLSENVRELFVELVGIFCIILNIFSKPLVVDQCHIGG